MNESRTSDISRRTFVRGAAAAGAALAIPFGVFAESTSKPAEKIGWGVIGAGHRGTIHITAAKSFPDDIQILGVSDVMPNHLDAGVKKAGEGVTAYPDYQKLLANPDIRAVLIATPNCVHKEVVLAALEAGKHVMCEKPMAASWDQCKAMKAAADAKPDQVMLYSMQLHYSPRYITLRKQIDDGKIGKVRQLLFVESRGDWNRGDVWQYDDPKQGKVNWRFSHAASGGTLSEKVCHYFDILNWMAGGSPERVTCVGGIAKYRDGRDTWDHANTTLSYADGVTATHNLCMFGPKRLELEVVGEDATLFINEEGLSLESGKREKESIDLPPEITHGERGPARGQETAVLRMYENFIDCVKNKKKPWMDAEKAMASSKIAWLGEMSSDQKREVKWEELS